MTMSWPSFLGPDGKEIVFRGRTMTAAGLRAGLFAVHPDGTGLRPLTRTDAETGAFYDQPLSSGDGRYVTYTDWDNARQLNSVHVLNLTTGVDTPLDRGTTRDQGFGTFSPDSRYLLFNVHDGPSNYLMREPVDGSSPAVQVGPIYPVVDGAYLVGRFSADSRSVIVTDEGSKQTRLVDVDAGGEGRAIEFTPADVYAVQRLAQ
jgi:Tol biopolymer transport system component